MGVFFGSSKTKSPVVADELEKLKPILEGPLFIMDLEGGKEWDTRHAAVYADARVELFIAKGDKTPAKTELLTGDHFVADAAMFTNGWQISDFGSVIYLACGSPQEKNFWMHAVAGVIRRLMEPMDALPPQYAKVKMHVADGTACPKDTTPLQSVETSWAEIARLKMELARSRTMQEEVAEAEIAALKSELELARTQLAEAQGERTTAEDSATALHGEIAKLKVECSSLKTENEFFSKEAAVANERHTPEETAELRAQIAKLTSDATRASTENAEAVATLEESLAHLKRDAEDTEAARGAEITTLKTEVAFVKRKTQEALPQEALPQDPNTPVKRKTLIPPPEVLEPDALEKKLVSETKGVWAQRIAAAREEQKTNVFSKEFDVAATKALKGGGYGVPVPGSETEARWARGKAWVEEQIAGLLDVIRDVGTAEDDGTVTCEFGLLFYTYADISDSLVGIMMRAKKRKMLYYQGDMLFQSKDDKVIITIPKQQEAA